MTLCRTWGSHSMATLYSQFVTHYTQTARSHQFRRIYEDAWCKVDRSNEVEAIREFLLDPSVGVDYLNMQVASKLSNGTFNVKFASIFCHKKPRVQRTDASRRKHPGDTKGCELGDLLVVFVLLDKNDKLHYASGALFQAKLRPKLDSLSQQCLYDFDTEFDVPQHLAKRFTPPNKRRTMPSPDEGRGRAFRYLILEPDYDSTAIRARHTPWTHDYQLRWSTFLHGLLAGTDGLRANLESPSPSAWDIIVADLLYVGLKVPAKKPARGNNVAVQVATSLFNNFTNLKDASVSDQENEGVPTLMIIAHASQYTEG
jgi:hypothetical protein